MLRFIRTKRLLIRVSSLHFGSELKLHYFLHEQVLSMSLQHCHPSHTMQSHSSKTAGEFESPWMPFQSPWNLQETEAVGARKRKRNAAASPAQSPWNLQETEAVGARKRTRNAAASPALADISSSRTKRLAMNLSHNSAGLQALSSAAQSTPEARKPNTHESLGPDPEQVKTRLRDATCHCQGPCHKAVKYKELLSVCQLFWGLSNVERGLLLRHEYHAAAEGDGAEAEGDLSEAKLKKVTWSLCGHPVCFPTFCHLLKTGEKTVRKQIAGVQDMRRSTIGGIRGPAPRKHAQTDTVDWFFWELYQSAAEPLPEDTRCIWAEMQGNEVQSTAFESPWAEQSSCPAVQQLNSSTVVQARELVSKGVPGADYNYVPQLSVNPVTAITLTSTAGSGLPVRYLQHVKLIDLHWQFMTAWDEQQKRGFFCYMQPPCFKTFSRRWVFWNKWLKIKAPSQHAQCQTCFELLRQINSKTASWGAKLQAARDLRVHYSHQYLDRCIYWSMRLMSQTDKDVLVIIIDGMDKSKFAWPRWPFDRVPKSMEKLIRPKMVLTAAIAHGWCTSLFLGSDLLDHGSSLWCECISQVLEEVWKISKKTGRKMPRHLVVVCDNTSGFAKNQYCMAYLAMLVAKCKFVTANLLFLMVGHTHEDIDQLFAVILWLLLRKKTWDTPAEVLQVLVAGLKERISQKGEVLIPIHLTALRDFVTWLNSLGLETKNCYKSRRGIETPRSFSMKLGCLLTPKERAQICSDSDQKALDRTAVYCCVKMFIRSTELNQPPVYLMPARQAEQMPQEIHMLARKPLQGDNLRMYLQLAQCCTELGMGDAAAALNEEVRQRRFFLPRLLFLETFQQPDILDLSTGTTTNPYFPHLPETSWRMVASLT